VMNLVASLAGRAMTELNEMTREDDPEVPEYLVDARGEWLVDPADPDARAAAALQYLRLSSEAERYGELATFGEDVFEDGTFEDAYEYAETAVEDDGEAAYENDEQSYEADDEAARPDDGGADFEADATGFDDGFDDAEDDEAETYETEADLDEAALDDENDDNEMDESDRWLMEAGFDDWGTR
jgi:hypothetical protein